MCCASRAVCLHACVCVLSVTQLVCLLQILELTMLLASYINNRGQQQSGSVESRDLRLTLPSSHTHLVVWQGSSWHHGRANGTIEEFMAAWNRSRHHGINGQLMSPCYHGTAHVTIGKVMEWNNGRHHGTVRDIMGKFVSRWNSFCHHGTIHVNMRQLKIPI